MRNVFFCNYTVGRGYDVYAVCRPYGTKALGEPPACSGAPAIRNAILNATGVAIDCCPITPHVLYRKFKEAGLIND